MLWLLLGGRHVELFQVRDQVLTGVPRAHLPVDVEDLAVRSDVERPVSFAGSARIGKSASSFFANAVLSARVSTLIMKYATSNARINWPLSRSALHSAVQPPVNALGNHASTTVLPRSLDSW